MESTDGSVVEFSPATREARVRFPVSAHFLFSHANSSSREAILKPLCQFFARCELCSKCMFTNLCADKVFGRSSLDLRPSSSVSLTDDWMNLAALFLDQLVLPVSLPPRPLLPPSRSPSLLLSQTDSCGRKCLWQLRARQRYLEMSKIHKGFLAS